MSNKDFQGLTVYVKPPKSNDPEEMMANTMRAWRKLKRKLQDEGVLQEYRDRQQYEKPSLVKRRERAMARKRWKKKEAQMKEKYGL